jgi:outer membrane protein OmpA-like peptidoglycan-associated protein
MEGRGKDRSDPRKRALIMRQRLVSSVGFPGVATLVFFALVGYSIASTAQIDSGKALIVKTAGHQLDNTIVSVIANAKVGGTTGTMINKQMDRQAFELKAKLKDAKVMRLEEGILITIDSRLLFDADSYGLRSKNAMLKDLARSLAKYSNTNAVIEGHTDNVAEEIYNKSLTEYRAHEIENYLIRKGIKDARMKTRGYGEKQPIASNESESGRQMNCRIEIAIYANDEMRRTAAPGDATYTALKQ